ncbi:MAG: hypothetical protein AB7H80_02170 [Candidatus Kapaibacterium sp.]
MSKLHFLFSLLSICLLLSCERPKSVLPEIPLANLSCSDLAGSDISYDIFTETMALWGQTFVNYYNVPVGSSQAFAFSLPADTLCTYLGGLSGCGTKSYDGVKAYLGLVSAIDMISDMPENLCLILVPYNHEILEGEKTTVDTVFPNAFGPCVEIKGTTRRYITTDTAQKYIDNWREHYTPLEEDIVVPIYSFVIADSTMRNKVTEAKISQFDSTVYFIFGFHTLSVHDSLYCFEQTKAHQLYPSQVGYAVHALILSARRSDGSYAHSSDFLRPCPRFCGTALFSLQGNVAQ